VGKTNEKLYVHGELAVLLGGFKGAPSFLEPQRRKGYGPSPSCNMNKILNLH
jgi:hypothetical protein